MERQRLGQRRPRHHAGGRRAPHHTGTAGYYRYRVHSYTGTGTYILGYDAP
ncbi:hypothetical protein [Streptomyces sp. KO7888]|uniref:hypothetical protein n=1 Tax=Streptomyces sp. KO7888 TaxID=2602737 RepID=UPI0013F61F03|nr:hypothetical protein [Streptomyces sp. KO7888]